MLGGALGAGGRYLLAGLVQRQAFFPIGTFVVNATGCLGIGLVAGVMEVRAGGVGLGLRLFLIIGVCGGFTTFSAFSYETFELLRANELWLAGLNVAGQVVIGFVAVWAGMTLARLL